MCGYIKPSKYIILLAILIVINVLIKILDSEKAIYPPKPEEEDSLYLYRQMDLYKECDYC